MLTIVAGSLAVLLGVPAKAQQRPGTGAAPVEFDTDVSTGCQGCSQGPTFRIRVVTLATGLVNPSSMAFLPDGHSILVTERGGGGRLRLLRDGALDPGPVAGVPVAEGRLAKIQFEHLISVAIHPRFAENHFVYVTYPKSGERGSTLAVARGRLDGMTLTDVHDIFLADAWVSSGAASFGGKLLFGPDGMLYLTVSDRDTQFGTGDSSKRMRAQDLGSHAGKVLRLRDDGRVPSDNPFVERAGTKPEIYTYGHRNMYGLAFHPETGVLWEAELGPTGGDEVNILLPGRNYGWPLVSLGRNYNGELVSDQPWWRPGIEMPRFFWVPALSPSSLTFVTSDRFAPWKGNLLVAGMSGRQVQRIAINQPPLHRERRESLLTELGLRFRDVQQGPDGYLYVAAEKSGAAVPDGAIMRIEPAPSR
jgi:glucose/arabinose dehydrogenase